MKTQRKEETLKEKMRGDERRMARVGEKKTKGWKISEKVVFIPRLLSLDDTKTGEGEKLAKLSYFAREGNQA